MKRRLLAFVLSCALALCAISTIAAGEDLLQIYRAAVDNDPTLASARAQWSATQEAVPQARSALLPNVSIAGSASVQDFYDNLHTDPALRIHQNFGAAGYTISASQPLFRAQNGIALDQARQQVGQSDYVFSSAQQDLIVRVTQAYLDVLLAQFNIELTESQKAAVSENLAQAKRNFEVGVATITDTNDAQAKYDQIVAQQVAVQNDLDNKRATLRAIIGRYPGELRGFGGRLPIELPAPDSVDVWIEQAVAANLQVRIAQANYDIAVLEVDRQRAAGYPVLDLVASFNQAYAGGAASATASAPLASDSRLAVLGLQASMPLYLGGLIESRVRQAIANQDAARQNLESARRNAQLQAQNAFTGVSGGAAQVKALEQAVTSAQVSYDSTRLGFEVGVRTNLDVLNQQQQVFQTRFNVAQAYYNFLISSLRLKSAVGTLTEADVAAINRQLSG